MNMTVSVKGAEQWALHFIEVAFLAYKPTHVWAFAGSIYVGVAESTSYSPAPWNERRVMACVTYVRRQVGHHLEDAKPKTLWPEIPIFGRIAIFGGNLRLCNSRPRGEVIGRVLAIEDEFVNYELIQLDD